MYTFTLFGLLRWNRLKAFHHYLTVWIINKRCLAFTHNTFLSFIPSRKTKRQNSKIKRYTKSVRIFFSTNYFSHRPVPRAQFCVTVCGCEWNTRLLSELAKLIFNGLNVAGVIFLHHHWPFAKNNQRMWIPFFLRRFVGTIFIWNFENVLLSLFLYSNQAHRIGFHSTLPLCHCLSIENVNWFLIHFSFVCWFPFWGWINKSKVHFSLCSNSERLTSSRYYEYLFAQSVHTIFDPKLFFRYAK